MAYRNREDLNAYQKLWKAANPDKVKAIKQKCNELHREEVSEYNLKYHQRKPWTRLILSAKRRANKYGRSFTLTEEWGKSAWTGRCALSGIEFDLRSEKERDGRHLSPSIDRIDNTQGYEPNNCRFILNSLNLFKGQMPTEQMLDIARKLLND